MDIYSRLGQDANRRPLFIFQEVMSKFESKVVAEQVILIFIGILFWVLGPTNWDVLVDLVDKRSESSC